MKQGEFYCVICLDDSKNVLRALSDTGVTVSQFCELKGNLMAFVGYCDIDEYNSFVAGLSVQGVEYDQLSEWEADGEKSN